jgi:signal transduction histidine kinase
MNSTLKFQSNPFPFLIYTEWILLASCGSLAFYESFYKPHFPVQHFLVLFCLGIMGTFLPTGKASIKILYTLTEFGLILYGTLLGYLHIMPALYMIAVIRSCFLFKPLGAWMVAGISFLFHVTHKIKYLMALDLMTLPATQQQSLWIQQGGAILAFGLAIVFVVKLVHALLRDRELREQLAASNEQLQEYAFTIEEMAATKERNRIARDIHDSLGHSLTALNIQLQTAIRLWHKDLNQVKRFLLQAQELGDQAMKEVRRSVGTLRTDASEEKTLEAVIESLVQNFQQGTGIPVAIQIDLETVPPPLIVKTIYRIVQESLTNICKYAHATRVQLQVSSTANWISLSVEDDGKGFAVGAARRGFGLQGMRERMDALSGSLQIETHPGAGCRILAKFPTQETRA